MTIIVSWWQLVLYGIVLLGTILLASWHFYDVGRRKGYQLGVLNERKKNQEILHTVPRRFVQRNPDDETRRTAKVSRARILARKQVYPEPRKGERDKQQ